MHIPTLHGRVPPPVCSSSSRPARSQKETAEQGVRQAISAIQESDVILQATLRTLNALQPIPFVTSGPPVSFTTPKSSFNTSDSSVNLPIFITPQLSPSTTPTPRPASPPPPSVLAQEFFGLPRSLTPTRQALEANLAARYFPLPTDDSTSSTDTTPTAIPTHPPLMLFTMPNNTYMPMASSHKAPQFSSDLNGFKNFFQDVKFLADCCNLSKADRITWAIRYASAEGPAWELVPCRHLDTATFNKFKEEVTTLYPHINEARCYTLGELDRLVNKTRVMTDVSCESFGNFYRLFSIYTQYLISKHHLSTREQDVHFFCALPDSLKGSVIRRLSIKFPDILPDDVYDLKDMYEASLFTLNSDSSASEASSESHALSPLFPPVIPKIEVTEQNTVSRLVQAMSDLTRILTTNAPSPAPSRPRSPRTPSSSQSLLYAPGGAYQNVPRRSPPRGMDGCMFCSAEDHFIRECPVAKSYMKKKLIERDDFGKIVLPGGDSIPSWVRGRNLCECIDNYWFGKEGQSCIGDPMSTNFFEGPDDLIFSMDINPVIVAYASSSSPPSSTSQSNSESSSEVDLIQLQINVLREAQVLALDKGKKRQQFNGVEIMQRHGSPRPGAPIPSPSSRVNRSSVPACEPQLPSHLSCEPPAQSSEPKSAAALHANPNVYSKPGT